MGLKFISSYNLKLPKLTAIILDEYFTWNRLTNTVYANIANLCPEYTTPSFTSQLPDLYVDDITGQLIKSLFISNKIRDELLDVTSRKCIKPRNNILPQSTYI